MPGLRRFLAWLVFRVAGLSWRDRGLTLTRRVFLGMLAAIYLSAFISLWVQVEGLIGSGGIIPAERFLAAVEENRGPERYWLVPSLFWLRPSDGFLHVLCGSGVALSLLAFFHALPAVTFLLLWVLYLSLYSIGGEFMSFQWDILLLESGFLAIFLAPWQLLPRRGAEKPPSLIAIWLVRLLAFRLIFASGLVKLLWDDEAWLNFTALDFHYETQPLPTWIGWYAHQLPGWFQKASCAVMYAIEIGLPFFFFGPRRLRQTGLIGQLLLQVLILLTGNYCFFNLLTIAVCLTVADDAFLRRVFRRSPPPEAQPEGEASLQTWIVRAVAPFIFLLGAMEIVEMRSAWEGKPAPIRRLQEWTAPLQIVNGYGLFRVMTTTRPEIVIEGSNDGVEWRAYEFRWKPGDPTRSPRFNIPHQPRLDWQMWFAALGNFRSRPFFQNLLARLLEGSPQVLALIETNPFPDGPPRHVRALRYEYRFTDFAARRATGQWWRRELIGPYSPVFSRRPGR